MWWGSQWLRENRECVCHSDACQTVSHTPHLPVNPLPWLGQTRSLILANGLWAKGTLVITWLKCGRDSVWLSKCVFPAVASDDIADGGWVPEQEHLPWHTHPATQQSVGHVVWARKGPWLGLEISRLICKSHGAECTSSEHSEWNSNAGETSELT